MTSSPPYLYVAPDLQHAAVFTNDDLAATTERHHMLVTTPTLQPVADVAGEMKRCDAAGVVFELRSGLPSAMQLQAIESSLQAAQRAWIYWPHEESIECVDEERVDSLRRHVNTVNWLTRICVPIDRAAELWGRTPTGLRWIYRGEFPVRRSDIYVKLTLLTLRAQPVPFATLARRSMNLAFAGTGVYLRTDYWNTGLDDERWAALAVELATVTDLCVSVTPRLDSRLTGTAVQQVAMDAPRRTGDEDAIVLAPTHYWPIVKAILQTLRPAYLYDHGAAGQSVGRRAARP